MDASVVGLTIFHKYKMSGNVPESPERSLQDHDDTEKASQFSLSATL